MALRMTFSAALRSRSGFASIVQSTSTHELDMAFSFAGLPLCVRDDVRDERLQIDRAASRARSWAVLQPAPASGDDRPSRSGVRRHARCDQTVILAKALAGKAERGIDTRERRTQFVRDIGDELPLTGDEGFDTLRHEVEVANQLADLVAAWSSVARPCLNSPSASRRAAARSRRIGPVKYRVSR